MAKDVRSWGILGNPSQAKINEYANMPVGSFHSMVKNLSRGKKNVVMKEFEIFIVRRKVDLTRGSVKVDAFDYQQAIEAAKLRLEEVKWDEQPYEVNKEEIVYQTIDPLKYKVNCKERGL